MVVAGKIIYRRLLAQHYFNMYIYCTYSAKTLKLMHVDSVSLNSVFFLQINIVMGNPTDVQFYRFTLLQNNQI